MRKISLLLDADRKSHSLLLDSLGSGKGAAARLRQLALGGLVLEAEGRLEEAVSKLLGAAIGDPGARTSTRQKGKRNTRDRQKSNPTGYVSAGEVQATDAAVYRQQDEAPKDEVLAAFVPPPPADSESSTKKELVTF